ncbi:MAG: carbon-nitrogen hydrolase family protein [Lachnospiraceae bacterium]|nr:carbon-nitrogen hydrolase family protein [Lachnospiraceae bacterium]
MRLAAYQFDVTGDVKKNTEKIKNAVLKAAENKADFIAFPECAISGYPPTDLPTSKDFDLEALPAVLQELQELSDAHKITILVGSIAFDEKYVNRAFLIAPKRDVRHYDKRALYGWDSENFVRGNNDGIFEINGLKVGVRICFEARFPEYFRELYKAKTDINVVIFYAVSDTDETDKYNVLRSHLISRAAENVTPIFAVDAITPFQSAPTCFINASGKVLAELDRNKEEIIFDDFEKSELNFGEIGRKRESDHLLGLE